MKNRTMRIVVVLSVLLLGGYNLLMTRYGPQKPPAPQVQAAQPAPAQAPAAASASGAPVTPAAGLVDPMARVSLKNDTLELTWRKGDGALVQAEWKDGTKFFPEAHRDKDGHEVAQDFAGLGAAQDVRFAGDPAVNDTGKGKEVVFPQEEQTAW